MNKLSLGVVIGCVLWIISGDPFYIGIGMGIGLGLGAFIEVICNKYKK